MLVCITIVYYNGSAVLCTDVCCGACKKKKNTNKTSDGGKYMVSVL